MLSADFSLDNSSSPKRSSGSSDSSDSELESEDRSESEEGIDGLDLEEGSAKCLEPDTDSRSGCRE